MKRLIFTMILVVAYFIALPQTEQKIHFWGTQIGSYGYSGTGLTGPYKGLLDKNTYYRLNTIYLSAPIFTKLNKNEQDYKVLFIYTGLCFQWNTLYFDDDIRINKGVDNWVVTREELLKSKRSKLVSSYISFPAMLEYQFNRNWYLTSGVDFKWRLGSHTKYVYFDENGDKKRDRDKSDFYLNGFQPDFVAKFGWAFLSLDFRYCLKPLFQEGKGPDVSTYSLGLMIGM